MATITTGNTAASKRWEAAQARIQQPGATVLQAWRAQHGPAARRAAMSQSQLAGIGRRMYAGAQFDRTTSDWMAAGTSADSELVTSLRPLRNRSRQLCRDNEYAKAARRTVMLNVVGRGIGLQAQVRMRRGDAFDTRTNDAIEKAWTKWARAKSCHTAGRMSWARLQQVIMQGVFESGEILVRMVNQKFGDSLVPMGLELIEADQIVDTWNGRVSETGNEIRMGVEVDQWQRPVAYWLYPRHPGDALAAVTLQSTGYVRVPASEVLHIALFDRPYQTRGEPWMHAALQKLRHMGGYEEAEIVAARASAAIMGFKQKPEVEIPGELADDADDVVDGDRVTDMAPGIIMELAPGETFTGFNPSRPNAALDPFMRFMLRSVAAGVGVSYESLSRDYSQSNYSSSRLALLTDRDLWRVVQDWLIETLCQPVFEAWLDRAVMAGAVNLPASYDINPEPFRAVRWAPRGWQWIDPVKESAAARADVRAGFATVTDILAEKGQDLEDHFRRRAEEVRLAKAYGLVLDTDPAMVSDKGGMQAPGQAGQAGAANPTGEPAEPGEATEGEGEEPGETTEPKEPGEGGTATDPD